jgi:chloride channel protein, CIC family
MGAVMGAALQGPLAALTAVIELTRNPEIIMPGMLAIVVASLISSEVFGKSSMFHTLLQASGLDYHTNPVVQSLRRVGVARFMHRNFVRTQPVVTRSEAQQMLAQSPEWIVIEEPEAEPVLMRAVDLVRNLKEQEDDPVNLKEIPAQRYELAPLRMQATLQEALETLKESSADALYIEWYDQKHFWRIQGILTRDQIESAYRI